MGEADIILLNEMFDRIQNLTVLDNQASIYDQIWEKSGEVEIFNLPSRYRQGLNQRVSKCLRGSNGHG